MIHQEILTKAIEKAFNNDWGFWRPEDFKEWTVEKEIAYHFEKADEADPNNGQLSYWASIIYDHDFAKALWGEMANAGGITTRAKAYAIIDSKGTLGDVVQEELYWEAKLPNWQFHLMQMAIADDAIAYLGHNI